MASLRLASLLLLSTLVAVPAVAATPDNSTASASPAATPAPGTPNQTNAAAAPNASTTAPADHNAPATAANTPAAPNAPMGAGMSANHHAPTTAANTPAPPKFMTSDNEVRIGKVIGASVYDDKGNAIGTVNDVLMSHDNKANTAVISLGGFLGIGEKLVSVSFDKLHIGKNKIVMPGATKDALKSMPEYKFNSNA